MADVPPQTSTSDTVYRPLSALAVAGFSLACLFGGIVLVSAAIAVQQGAPFFFPEWILLVAVAAFVLSYSGVNDIRNSEGTKAGAGLASWGMGLSLVCGLGYFAYSYFTGLALTQQANAFLTVAADDESGWFPRIQKGGRDKTELYRAFLFTLPAFDRAGVRPDDEAGLIRLHDAHGPDGSPGQLSQFLNHHLVTYLVQAGDEARIEPLGVQRWTYENRSYQVKRIYRIQSPEATTEVVLTVKSSEGEAEGQGRSWFLDVRNAQMLSHTLTTFGEGVDKLRKHALGTLQHADQALRYGAGKVPDAPQIDFAKVDRTDWEKVHAEKSIRDDIKLRVLKAFEGGAVSEKWQLKPPSEGSSLRWRPSEGGRVEVDVPVQAMFANTTGMTHLGAEALFTLRTKVPVDIAQIAEIDNARSMPAFDIVAINFTRAYSFMRP